MSPKQRGLSEQAKRPVSNHQAIGRAYLWCESRAS